MKVSLFDFNLPEENIALRPLQNREDAKLLYVNKHGDLTDYKVADIIDLLNTGDVLVFNDTKVLPANLKAVRSRFNKAKQEHNLANINVNLHMQCDRNSWRAFVRPLKRLNIGEKLYFIKHDELNLDNSFLQADVLEKYNSGEVLLKFNLENVKLNEAIVELGKMPLPPYIASRRKQDEQDKTDYQTIFAKEEGAVAAPTAGLHFTQNLFQKLKERNIEHYFVTLHVGAGTFLPVKADDTKDHKMHSEIGYLSNDVAKALNTAKLKDRRIIAVGTTALRLLESAAIEKNKLKAWSGPTDIFITPGYKFDFVDGLITNFHLPKSTLFMLVSAFCGIETMKKAYRYAISNNYRFYSYGDTSFLELNS